MLQPIVQYVKRGAPRDILCLVTAVLTAYAYGLIDEDQLFQTLDAWHIPLQKILPTLIKLAVLPPLMGVTVFALNFTKNRENFEELRTLFKASQLKKAIFDRLNYKPHENIIAAIGSGAEFNIIFNALRFLINNSNNSAGVYSFGVIAALSAALQYLIVDGQSLIDASWPKFDVAHTPRNFLIVMGAYCCAVLGASTMGLLSFNSSQQIFLRYIGNEGLRKAYADSLATAVASIYAGLDFTLYGLELVEFALSYIRKERLHPELNSFSRYAKFLLALNGFILMAIVGYGSVTKFFYPDYNAPWWSVFPFLPLALITGAQIYITECRRLIKLGWAVETGNDHDEEVDNNVIPSIPEYRFKNFLLDCMRTTLSFGVSSLTLVTLTEGFGLPQNWSIVTSAIAPFAVTNTVNAAINDRKETGKFNLGFNFSYSVFIFLVASFATWAWRALLQSNYAVDEATANEHCKYAACVVGCLLALAQKRVQPCLRWPCFFASSPTIVNREPTETTALINAVQNDMQALDAHTP